MAGIYIHIPFCRQACTYCDFHFSTSVQFVDSMMKAIEKEIILRKHYHQNEKVETIYFGGGTPSFIDDKYLASVINLIRNEYDVNDDTEITLEANPDDLDAGKSERLFNMGINRLSIGIQSFHDEELRFMNRAHDAHQAIDAIENVKKSGFEDISIDLIYGMIGSSTELWKKNVELAISIGVDHLSCYALTVEKKTALADMIRKKKVAETDDERTAVDFSLLMNMAVEAGYEHYEISNFARNGKYSKHNTSYWQGKKYTGIGPSAHSYDGVSRQWNVANNIEYINSIDKEILPYEKEILTMENKYNEYILISLRTIWGIDTVLVEKNFGSAFLEKLLSKLLHYTNEGMVIQNGNRFVLTGKGKFFADRIAGDLFI